MQKLALVSVLCAGAIAANAAVIWNQGPEQGAYAGCWSQNTLGQELVDDFTMREPAKIRDLHIYSCFATPGGNTWEITLYADNAGAPGAELVSFTDTYDQYVAAGTFSGNPIYRADFSGFSIPVSGGVKYWIGASGVGFESAVVSGTGSAQGNGQLAFRSSPTGSWNVINSIGDVTMQITGDIVPEPASMIALGVGALALLRRRNRK